jgi:hypothetical protein
MLWLVWALACKDPVADCDVEGKDCCVSDEECVGWFGDAFGRCATPGRKTGICAECVTGDDCSTYEVCVEDEVLGAFCESRDA